MQISILQRTRFVYDTEITIRSWRANDNPSIDRDVQTVTLQAVQFNQNLQFDVASHLVPWFIDRKELDEVDAFGHRRPVQSVEQFLASTGTTFKGRTDTPLFRQSKVVRGSVTWTEKAVEVAALSKVLEKMATEASLPMSRSFRRSRLLLE